MAKEEKKGNVGFECHTFRHVRVTELCGKASCLLYKGTIAVIKEYDIHQNYKTKHSSQYSHLTGKQWPEKK